MRDRTFRLFAVSATLGRATTRSVDAEPDRCRAVTGEPSATVMERAGEGAAASARGASEPFDWASVRGSLATGAHILWLTTASPDGVPHVVPVFAAWEDAHGYVATNAAARKTRDLEATGRCVLATDLGDAHVVIEATARRLHEPGDMDRAVSAFRACFGWPTTAVGDELHAPYAAPTSGGSPFQVWQVEPVKAFAFPADGESNAPTRWTFPGSTHTRTTDEERS